MTHPDSQDTREGLVERLGYVVKMARQYEAAVIRVPDAVHGAGERLEQAKRELLTRLRTLPAPSEAMITGAMIDAALDAWDSSSGDERGRMWNALEAAMEAKQ